MSRSQTKARWRERQRTLEARRAQGLAVANVEITGDRFTRALVAAGVVAAGELVDLGVHASFVLSQWTEQQLSEIENATES